MRLITELSVLIKFLLFSTSLAHSNTPSGHQASNGPLFGSVMKYFGESEAYNLPSSGLFDDVDASSQQISVCLRNFEVSEGSIIRTKDSQALGAHYLNETDLGAKSREECLKLCCKISQCNVAVFEEKNSGSCYLFDCGSIEDFRCKFTSQVHYVSAILRHRDVVPHSLEHSGSIMGAHINSHSHNQHEDELSQLRSDKTVATSAGIIPSAVVSSERAILDSKMKQAGGKEVTRGGNSGVSSSSTLSPVDGNTESRKCSRWQFECKSSGECIAIYNVCDQIPNCPGAEDEDPSKCPAYSLVGGGGPMDPNKLKESSSSGMMTPQQQAQGQQTHHPQPPVPIGGSLEKPMTTGNNANSAGQGSGLKNQAPLRQEYPPNSIADGGNGMLTIPRKSDQALNIFNHKDGGIMEDAYGNRPQLQAMHNNNYGQFWKSPNYDYGNGESQSINIYGPGPQPPQQYPNNGLQYGNGANYGNSPYHYNSYQGMPSSQKQSSSQGMQILPQQSQYQLNNNFNMPVPNSPQQSSQLYYGRQPQPSLSNVAVPNSSSASQQANAPNQVVQTNPINPSNPKAPEVTTTVNPSVGKQLVQNTESKSNSVKDAISKVESEIIKSLKSQSPQSSSEVQSEELSPHTAGGGAILIFILGLGMSIVMVIIVGCRLRRVGRRQRGKNRLDPDYLVDGMYL